MAQRRTIFGVIRRVDAAPHALESDAARAALSVEFEGGETAYLDAADPRSEAYRSILEEAREVHLPVHVTVDENTNVVSELRIPLPRDGVASIVEVDPGTLEVELHLSQARHFLRRSNPDFEKLRGDLERASGRGAGVIITETDDHEIIDVQETTSPFAPRGPAEEAVAPEAAPAAISLADAEKLFAMVNGKSCDPKTPKDPCITFLFPDDGCYARAHEMCRLIGTAKSGKVWNYGKLVAKTANHPDCKVEWKYHVAPTVPVKSGSSTVSYVLDPSLFTKPVTVAAWTGVQGDAKSTTVETDAEPFYRAPDGKIMKDADYSQTKAALINFRLQLKNRSASAAGAPPYAKCVTELAPRVS